MNRKLTAALLVTAAVLTNAAFTVLGTVFNYPDVLKEPTADVLATFRDHQGPVAFWFAVMAVSAALFAPIAIGVGRAVRLAVADVIDVPRLFRGRFGRGGFAFRSRFRAG